MTVSIRELGRAGAGFAAGSGGLLLALALALLLLPERPAPLRLFDTLLLPTAFRLTPAPAPTAAPGVLRLPTAATASPAEQLAAMDRLAQTLPALERPLLWLPDAALAAALDWAPAGRRLQRALAAHGAATGPLTLPQAPAVRPWQALLAAEPAADPAASGVPGAVGLVHAGVDGPLGSPLLRAFGNDMRWQHGRGLTAGNRRLTGPDGHSFPRPLDDAFAPQELRLDALPAALPPLVLVGAAGDPALDRSAAALAALATGAYAYSPWWSRLADAGVVTLLLVCYLLLLPRVSAGTGFLLTVLVALAVVAAQFGLQVTRAQWLPLGGAYAMVVLGYPLAALGAFAVRRRARLQDAADAARLQLAQYQIRQNELDPARTNLLATAPMPRRLELLYELAIAYERRRQYAQAREVFLACVRQDKTFRDVRARLDVLSQLDGAAAGPAQAFSNASTLVMPKAVEKPVLGRYRVERELGRGAMGVVYLGVDPKIGREVAIKTLDMAQLPQDEVQEFKARFFREAEAAGRLSHPNIVTVYDVGEERELAFIAMDYAPGKPLSDFVDPKRLLPVETVYHLVAQVAEALDYAHARGVVHRDIKPANLIYDPKSESLKITDFGIARIGDTRRTTTGTVLGSPSYMAPEQIAGGRIEGTADLFSLGVTFYQLLTGKLPFAGENITQLAYQISQGRHKDVRKQRPDLPTSASRIVNKALAKKPEDRFRRGAEMAEALRRAMSRQKVT